MTTDPPKDVGIGAGKYDPECTAARESAKAAGVLLMVIAGDRGHGFSVQADMQVLLQLPGLLRSVADDIEYCNKKAVS
jgi:hypothetical protein